VDAWIWAIVVITAVTWLPTGYLDARFINASGLGHLAIAHVPANGTCTCESWRPFQWKRPVETSEGRFFFLIGILLGWTLVPFTIVAAFTILGLPRVLGLLDAIGRRLAP
jgi:hypothetical protein